MTKRTYKKLKNGFKRFVLKEPVYMWLAVFILAINILALIPNPDMPDNKPAPEKEESQATKLLQDRIMMEKMITGNARAAFVAVFIIVLTAVCVFIGLLLDFAILIASAGRDGGLLHRSHAPPKVKWSIWDALKVIILFFFFGHCLIIIAALLLPLFPQGADTERVVSMISTTIMDIVGIAIVFYFVFSYYKQRTRDLGLTMKNFLRNVSYGLLGYLSLLPILFVTLVTTALIVGLFRYKPAPQPVFELFIEEKNAPVLVYFSFFVAVAGPIMEEIFFRGFVYAAVKKELGINPAIVVSAILFSFLHVYLVGFLPILILGMFLAYLYEKTGSLVPSITVHVLHNLVMVVFIFLLKGVT